MARLAQEVLAGGERWAEAIRGPPLGAASRSRPSSSSRSRAQGARRVTRSSRPEWFGRQARMRSSRPERFLVGPTGRGSRGVRGVGTYGSGRRARSSAAGHCADCRSSSCAGGWNSPRSSPARARRSTTSSPTPRYRTPRRTGLPALPPVVPRRGHRRRAARASSGRPGDADDGSPAKIDLIRGDAHGGGSSSPAALTGYPSISVPAGFAFGLPVGLTFMGTAWNEPELLSPA